MRVEPGWIDYNGHLNMAYYSVLFDRAIDELWAAVGLGPDYRAERGMTTFAVQSNVSFLREVNLIDTVRVTLHLIDHDEKRMHIWAEMRQADEGWLASTNESMHLHVNLESRRVAPMPPEILAAFAALKASHGRLPRPAGLGVPISMRPQPREEKTRRLN
jgi:acyl-CoA thioester hydrolase